MKNALLIDPAFPHPPKSKNHQDILPIGLLKIGACLEDHGWDVRLVRLSESSDPIEFTPSVIWVTSLFTYWSKYVIEAVEWAKKYYPYATIHIGGVWASLMPVECKRLTGADYVHIGVMYPAEEYEANYNLLSKDVDYQIMHTQRGCHRKCDACGVHLYEQLSFKDSIRKSIHKKKTVFYDNNLLLNPYIESILKELIILKRSRQIKSCESQSGFDGRILRKKPYLAKMLKMAGFIKPKIAWDGSLELQKIRKKEIDILIEGGYKPKEISVFMLYNHELSFDELENKRRCCWDWKVQVTNCRYRPLDALDDQFHGKRKNQTTDDYFIHPIWSDEQVKKFNQNVRRHNMCLRFGTLFHSRKIQYKKVSKELSNKCRKMTPEEASKYLDDVWNPADFHGVDES